MLLLGIWEIMEMKKIGEYGCVLLCVFSILIIFFCLQGSHFLNFTKVAQAKDTQEISLYTGIDSFQTPSLDAKTSFIYGYNPSGFTAQPADLNMVQGQKKSLSATIGLAYAQIPNPLTRYTYIYQWYEAADPKGTQGFTKINGATDASYELNNLKVGTHYFQLWYERVDKNTNSIIDMQNSYFSRIAKVEVFPEKPIQQVKVTTNKEYLYNNQNFPDTAKATAIPTPSDTTSRLSWSSSDPALAKVDNDGVVTSNTNQNSGKVTITARYTNTDGVTYKEGSAIITVGGGLNDQRINSGEDLTLKILGMSKTSIYQVRWFKVGTSNPVKTVIKNETTNQNNLLTYTVKGARKEYNGSQYYAEINCNTKDSQGQIHSGLIYTTRAAKVSVDYDPNPIIVQDWKIYNDSFANDHNDGNTTIGSVHGGNQYYPNGDWIRIVGSVKDINPDTDVKNSMIKFNLPTSTYPDTQRSSVNGVSGKIAFMVTNEFPQYQTSSYAICTADFTKTKQYNIVFSAQTTGADVQKYISYPYVVQKDPTSFAEDGSRDYWENKTKFLTIYFVGYNFLSCRAKDIQFGQFQSLTEGQTIKGKIEGGTNPVLEVSDRRREDRQHNIEYKPQTVSLISDGEFINAQGIKLPATLQYVDGKNSFTFEPNSTTQQLASYGEEQTVQSVNWGPNQGLKLKMNKDFSDGGSYSAKLTWQIADTLPNT